MPVANTNEEGLLFPMVNGKRSTSVVGPKIIAAALAVVDPKLAGQAAKATNWRSDYAAYFHKLTELATQNPGRAVDIANAGLAAAQALFEFSRDGNSQPLNSVAKAKQAVFTSAVITLSLIHI